MLHGLGVTRYAQIAAWTDEDIARIDPQLGAFSGRIRRDNWVEQAKYLAAGDAVGFEGRFGKLS
jgi:predicted flap endonuclease-1-like 5' DNA nuclease